MSTETISEFFSGQNVLVTGVTGFMGKVLVEKLLHSCPDIGDIYLLMREKRGKTPCERRKHIINCQLFDALRKEQPKAVDKLKPITGDVSQLNLGLSPHERAMLKNNVTIIFHVAASVRFDDCLKDSIILNTRGTREVVSLGLEMKQLKVLIYISTAYTNIDQKVIEEKLYPPHGDWSKLIRAAETLDHFTLDVVAKKVTGSLGNNYVFSKSLAEHVVSDMCRGKVPAIIVRPSIVVPTVSDPMPGWVENFNGPVGLLIGSGKGILRIIYSDPDTVLDFIPVDVAIRGIITATWIKCTRDNSKSLEVYNCSGDGLTAQPVKSRDVLHLAKQLKWDVPLNNPIWYPSYHLTASKLWYYLNIILFHFLPALAIDGLLLLQHKRARLVKLQRRIYTINMLLGRFANTQWKITNKNFMQLNEQLSESDRCSFHMERCEDPYKYFRASILACRPLLLKEDNATIPKAKAQQYRLYVLHKVTTFTVYALTCWWLLKRVLSISFVEIIQ